MEIIPLKAGRTLVLDGAHNAQKIAVLMKSLKARFPKATLAVLVSFGQNKDFQLRSSMREITAAADHLIITSFGSAQDSYKVSINPIKIAEQCHVLGYDSWETISDASKAYRTLLKRPESLLLITGSFYLLHGLRPLIEKSPKP
jgi:folylpolyglutamate synthase/dihydropteroate synthase